MRGLTKLKKAELYQGVISPWLYPSSQTLSSIEYKYNIQIYIYIYIYLKRAHIKI